MRNFNILSVVLAAGLLMGGSSQAKADIIFNDYGPKYAYNTNNGLLVDGPASTGVANIVANEFRASQSEFVTSIDLGVSLQKGTNSLTVSLMTDNDGVPGSVLESYDFVNQMGEFGSQNGPLIATSLLNPSLVAGTNYWLVVAPGDSGTSAAWNLNDQRVLGPVSDSSDGGAKWGSHTKQTLGAFEVFGEQPPSATPEPGSLVLWCTGVASFGVFGWLQKRKMNVVAVSGVNRSGILQRARSANL